MFFIQKFVNNNLFKNHIIILWNVLQVISFQNFSGVFAELNFPAEVLPVN